MQFDFTSSVYSEDQTATVATDFGYEAQKMNEQAMLDGMARSIEDEDRAYKEQELQNDDVFVYAAKRMYEKKFGKQFIGEDSELIQTAMQEVSLMRDNTAGMANLLASFDEMDEEDKLSTYYLFDALDKTDEDNVKAIGRFLTSAGLDPSTYIGLGSFKFVTAPGQQAAKQTILSHMREKIMTPAKLAALEGAMYGGGFMHGEERVKEEAGYGYDPTAVGLGVGIGTALGGGAVKGGEALIKGIGKLAKEGEELAMQSAGGGTPPVVGHATAIRAKDDIAKIIEELDLMEQQRQQWGKMSDEELENVGIPPKMLQERLRVNVERKRKLYGEMEKLENKAYEAGFEIDYDDKGKPFIVEKEPAEEYSKRKEPILHNGDEIGTITTSRYGKFLNIDDVEVTKSGTGSGTKAIEEMMNKADAEDITLTITSDAMRGKEVQKKNRELYKKLGFTKNSGKDKIKGTSEEFYYVGGSI